MAPIRIMLGKCRDPHDSLTGSSHTVSPNICHHPWFCKSALMFICRWIHCTFPLACTNKERHFGFLGKYCQMFYVQQWKLSKSLILQVFPTWNKLGSATGGCKEKSCNFFLDKEVYMSIMFWRSQHSPTLMIFVEALGKPELGKWAH